MPTLNAPPAPIELAHALERFLADHPRAAVLDDGQVLFDLQTSNYSLSTDHGRCVVHFWSEERNLIRTVVGVQERSDSLRILVRKLGCPRPQSLQVVPDRDRRTPTSRTLARSSYLRLLERVLVRSFSDYKVQSLRSAMDLENSFGPAYARGLLVRGQQSWAVIGTSSQETQGTIDGILTLGILWLTHCRQRSGARTVCHGLKVIVPKETASVTQARMAWLNEKLGAWELYELCDTSEELLRIDTSGEGNLKMRLIQAFDPKAAIERVQPAVDRVMRLLPDGLRHLATVRAKNSHEVAFALYGLEFARVRHGFAPNSFTRQDNITFGAGANETVLDEGSEAWFADLVGRLFHHRHANGSSRDPLYRLQPEGWLESILREEIDEIEPSLRSSPIYSQVPAFAAADRGMLDLLTVTKGGQLAVLELKADEDLHLPLQGLDYWIRVRWLNEQRGPEGQGPSELEQNGYFPGIPLLKCAPLLFFVAPALRIHPSTEMVLAHFSPAIQWTMIALNEGWRSERKVVFRKRGPL